MEFVVLIVDRKDESRARAGEHVAVAEMGRFSPPSSWRGKMRGGTPLYPESEGARVARREGRTFVSDGPFAECKEVVGGSLRSSKAASREEAIEIAKRCPHARRGYFIEMRRAPDRDVVLRRQPRPALADAHSTCRQDLTDTGRLVLPRDGRLRRRAQWREATSRARSSRSIRTPARVASARRHGRS